MSSPSLPFNTPKPRESQFELIRILAQFFIVLYHLYFFFVWPTTGEAFHKAIWLPLHIGVPLFIMISGYFGIRSSVRGFVKLLCMMIVLYIPLEIIYLTHTGAGIGSFAKMSLFVTWSPFWFMRTYVYLYLLAPLINRFLDNCPNHRRWALLAALFFIGCYSSSFGNDGALAEGKNVVTFMFLYVIGNTLHHYRQQWSAIARWKLIALYLAYNVALVWFATRFDDIRGFNAIFARVLFGYSSIGLIFNAMLVFMILGSIKFQSKAVNFIAKSSLVIYMLHCSNLILMPIIGPAALWALFLGGDNQILILFFLSLIVLAVIAVAVIINTLCTYTFWPLADRLGRYLQSRYNTLISRLDH